MTGSEQANQWDMVVNATDGIRGQDEEEHEGRALWRGVSGELKEEEPALGRERPCGQDPNDGPAGGRRVSEGNMVRNEVWEEGASVERLWGAYRV